MTGGRTHSWRIAFVFSFFDLSMKRIRFPSSIIFTTLALTVTLALGGCGLFGCAGWASNGGGFGGCSVGTRF
jgi:hypothetical protein